MADANAFDLLRAFVMGGKDSDLWPMMAQGADTLGSITGHMVDPYAGPQQGPGPRQASVEDLQRMLPYAPVTPGERVAYGAGKASPFVAGFAPMGGMSAANIAINVLGGNAGAAAGEMVREGGGSVGSQLAGDIGTDVSLSTLLAGLPGIVPAVARNTAESVGRNTAEGTAQRVGRDVTGTLGQDGPPVMWKGRTPDQWGPSDFFEYGKSYGVDNFGPADSQKWLNELEEVVVPNGLIYDIPGGLNSKEPFTYYDLLYLKRQALNPNDLPPGMHKKLHDRVVNTMSNADVTDTQITNQLLFGLMSSNNPLTPNELGLARVMAKGPEDVRALGDMIPWRAGAKAEDVIKAAQADMGDEAFEAFKKKLPKLNASEKNPKGRTWDELTPGQQAVALRQHEYSSKIYNRMGLQAAEQGGIGATGSVDYTNLSEFAQLMRQSPEFYRFNKADYPGVSDEEAWLTYANRVANQTRGLQTKTAALSGVWQAPEQAQISAVDRWMAKHSMEDMFPDDATKLAWSEKQLFDFNKMKGTKLTKLRDIEKVKGGPGFLSERALAYVGASKSAKRLIKGQPNPKIPQALHDTKWITEAPDELTMTNDAYLKALQHQQESATGAGHNLFSHQWYLWDKMRQRFEPHEALFPGLEKLPRMTLDQVRDTRASHSKAGYDTIGPVRPIKGEPGKSAYWSFPLGLGLSDLFNNNDEEN